MAIPSEIQALIDRLNQEMNETEQEATEGLTLTRQNLSRFPDNAILIQFFASFSNLLMFVDLYRRRVQATVEELEETDVPSDLIQEVGEDLATILGQVLEAKINANRLKSRLENR